MMTLLTGNRFVRRLKGFTLIEVMIATAVLAVGVVLIYEAFFISLDSFDYCNNYITIAPWMNEKVCQVQHDLNRLGPQAFVQNEGSIVSNSKEIGWQLLYSLIDSTETQDLYKINLILSWQEGRRKTTLSRVAYARYEVEE